MKVEEVKNRYANGALADCEAEVGTLLVALGMIEELVAKQRYAIHDNIKRIYVKDLLNLFDYFTGEYKY